MNYPADTIEKLKDIHQWNHDFKSLFQHFSEMSQETHAALENAINKDYRAVEYLLRVAVHYHRSITSPSLTPSQEEKLCDKLTTQISALRKSLEDLPPDFLGRMTTLYMELGATKLESEEIDIDELDTDEPAAEELCTDELPTDTLNATEPVTDEVPANALDAEEPVTIKPNPELHRLLHKIRIPNLFNWNNNFPKYYLVLENAYGPEHGTEIVPIYESPVIVEELKRLGQPKVVSISDLDELLTNKFPAGTYILPPSDQSNIQELELLEQFMKLVKDDIAKDKHTPQRRPDRNLIQYVYDGFIRSWFPEDNKKLKDHILSLSMAIHCWVNGHYPSGGWMEENIREIVKQASQKHPVRNRPYKYSDNQITPEPQTQ